MKRNIFLVLISLAMGFGTQAQSIVFHENFELPSLADSVSSGTGITGGNNWSVSGSLAATGLRSDSCQVSMGDTSYLTTNAFSTSGLNGVLLEFNHICKIEWADAAEIFVSGDNGSSWTKLTENEYLGTGNFWATLGDKFSAVTYVTDWQAANNFAMPTNTWWKHEIFDISAIAGNASQVRVRFVLRDANNNGASFNYGWLIDDIVIKAAAGELVPPNLSMIAPLLKDTVNSTGPFDIYTDITDASGIDTAYIVYSVNSGANDTVGMTHVSGNLYSGYIPSLPFQTTVCYFVEAIDSSPSGNINREPGIACTSFYIKQGPEIVQIGQSPSSAYESPVYISGSSAGAYSNHISLFTPSELAFSGLIESISWNKANSNSYSANDGELKIYLKHTSASTVSGSTSFSAEIVGATLAYSSTTQSIDASTGWKAFTFDTASSFHYNGTDNLLVMVEWHRPSQSSVSVEWFYTGTSGRAVTFYGSAANPTAATALNNRPDIRVGFYPDLYTQDAGIHEYLSPKGVVLTGSPHPVKIRLKNYGSANLGKATINWTLDGAPQLPQVWTGNLPQYLVSNDLVLSSQVFSTGPHTVKAWTLLPNDSIDQNHFNDTIKDHFYVCTEILNGTYSLGGTQADFLDFAELLSVLNNCGISGPVTINVNPGIYNEQVLLSSDINGLSAANTLTIQSVSSDNADVTIQYAATNPGNDYVVKVTGNEGVAIKNMTIKAIGSTYGNAIVLENGVRGTWIKGNRIICPAGSQAPASSGIQILKTYANNTADNGYCVIEDNTVTRANKGILVSGGGLSHPNKGIVIRNNSIRDFHYAGIDINYTDSINIISNEVISSASSLTPKGIWLDYGLTGNVISGNRISITGSGYNPAGIEVTSSDATQANPNLILNNLISVQGSSTSANVSGIHLSGGGYNQFYNNSVLLTAGSALAKALFIESQVSAAGTANAFVNNNISNSAGGYVIWASSNAASNNFVTVSDFNNLHTSGSVLGIWGTTAIPVSGGIPALHAASGLDSSSLIADPGFYSNLNLHSYSQAMNGAATPLSVVTTDFDGDIRNLSTPDIGADEYTLSAIDAGVVSIIEPLPVDTQNNLVTPMAVLRNFGLSSISSMNIRYSLNGGASVNFAWTGNLASGAADTVALPNLSIPVGNYGFCAWTVLTGDTLSFNDTLCDDFYGLPLQDAELVSVHAPADGCDLGQETVSIRIVNAGVAAISSGLQAHYKILGSSTVVTENVAGSILPGDSLSFDFSTKADMSVTTMDSLFEFRVYLTLNGDVMHYNDSLTHTALSLSNLAPPQINDTTINYGDSVTLTAISPYIVEWFATDTSAIPLSIGQSFTSPPLTDTTVYYLKANESLPPLEVAIGNGTQSNPSNAFPNPYYGQGQSNRQQFLYLASELNAAGLSASAIENFAFYIASTNGLTKLEGIEIRLGHTSTGSLTGWQTGLTTVYTASIYPLNYPLANLASGWNVHELQVPFSWNGTDNLVVEICYASYSFGGINASVRQAPTTYTSSGYVQQNGACTATGFTGVAARPDIRIKTIGTLGCTSIRVPVQVNVPIPFTDIQVLEITSPSSGCGLTSSDVSVRLVNKGLNTISGGLTASYRIDNGAYLTPSAISNVIYPGDTLDFTFPTPALLPSGPTGTDYAITVKANLNGDTYHANDSVVKSPVNSAYTPAPPVVVTPVAVGYGQAALLTAVATDTVQWYSDSLGINQVGSGTIFNTGPLYSNSTFYSGAVPVVPPTPYAIGTGTGTNSTSVGPSPFGAASYTAWGLRNQFLVRASEMQAMGMLPGDIESLAFNIASGSNATHVGFTIQVGTTSVNELTQFESGLTTVWNASSYTETGGWNTFQFSQPIYWDGQSNIIIQTCFKNTAWVTTGYALSYITPTSYVSSINSYAGISFSCTMATLSNSYYARPNIRFVAGGTGACSSELVPVQVNVGSCPPVDAGITSIVSPSLGVTSTASSAVKVVLKNFGCDTLTSASIVWTEKGYTNTYSWTGSLLQNETDTVLIDNHTFKGGHTTVSAWVNNPNMLPDTNNFNDTAHVSLNICMSGSYTIGSISSDYSSIQDALDDMIACSVCASVIFDIDSGFYGEQITLPPITGAGPNATITFRSASSINTDVVIQYYPSTAKPYIIGFDGADYVTFKDMTIRSTGNMGSAVLLDAGATHNGIVGNLIYGPASTSSTSGVIYSLGSGNNYNLIDGNQLINSYHGIMLKGFSTGDNKGNVIKNNSISDFNNYGIYLFYEDSVTIEGNHISNGPVSSSSITGIFVQGSNGANRITYNRVIMEGASNGICIRYHSNTSTVANPALIANNFMSRTNASATVSGLDVSSCQNLGIYYNSVRIDSANTTSAAFNVASSGSNYIVKDNVFSNFGPGYAIYLPNTSVLSQCDYNDYYTDTTSGKYAFWVADVYGLAALKQLSGTMNQHSVTVNPGFVSAVNLHITGFDLNDSGIPIAGILDDIDGETRNASTPDMGADEFTPPPYDIGAIALVNPVGNNCFDATMPVTVRIRNFGTNPLDFAQKPVTVHVVVSGTSPTPITPFLLNSGVLAIGAVLDVNLTNSFNMSVAGTYNFMAFTTASWDTTTLNDTMVDVILTSNPVITAFPFDEDCETFTIGSGTTSNPGLLTHGWKMGSNVTNLGWYPKTGATATSNTGPQGDHTTGLGQYIYFESSFGSLGSEAWLSTNCMDLSGMTNPEIKFYYHMFGAGTGSLYIEAMDAAGVFVVLDSIVGQQQSSQVAPWLLKVVNLSSYTSAYTRVRFRAVKLGGEGDIALDDFLVLDVTSIDLAVKSFVQPLYHHGPVGNSVTVEMEIENYGTNTLQDIPLGYIYAGITVRDTLYGALAPNHDTTFTFTVPFNVISSKQDLTIFSSVAGDINATNDSVHTCFVGISTFQVPWSDGFEAADNWAGGCDGLWQRGMPSAALINTPHGGTTVWATNLGGQYPNNSHEYLYSPYMTIPTTSDTAYLQFWHWMDAQVNNDYGRVEYSLNGTLWSGLGFIGSVGSLNWYNANINGLHSFSSVNTGWQFSKIRLDPAVFNTGNPFQFRFVFHSNASVNAYEGWAIDDFAIVVPQYINDCGVSTITYPVNDTLSGSMVSVTITVENFATNSLSSVPVTLFLNNQALVTDTLAAALAGGTTISHTFSLPYTVPLGAYTLCAATSLTGDVNNQNDSVCKSFAGLIPQVDDVGISHILEPVSDTICFNAPYAPHDVTVRIMNFSTATQTSIPVQYKLGSSTPVQELWIGSLAGGDSVDFTFATKFYPSVGIQLLCSRTLLTNDFDASNDEACKSYLGVICSGIDDPEGKRLVLFQNIPNPASNKTIIEYIIPTAGKVRFEVRNSIGETVYTELLTMTAGTHQIELDLSKFAAGLYHYSIETAEGRVSRKLIHSN